MQNTIPLPSLSQYPAFLSAAFDTVTVDSPLRSISRFTAEHRSALVTALEHDLGRWEAPPGAMVSASRFAGPDSYAVVTGQQAGIATGPLYTLYKAVGAVLRARQLEEEHPGTSFVPVFWMEADDHDFDEARVVRLLDRGGNVAAVAYDDGDPRPLHVGDRPVSREGLERFVEELRALIPATEFTDGTISLLESSYRDGTLADGFARSLYAILGETPLVVASSRNAGLKRLAAELFAAEAADPDPLHEAMTARTDQLRAEGRPVPITPKRGVLFLTEGGERRALDAGQDGYHVRGSDRRMSFAEAAALAREQPELISPNVVLRPLVQDAIFPTALYLGGPSEVAYLDQIAPAYERFGMVAPAVGPRPFVLLLEPKVRRVLEGARLELGDLLAEEFDAASRVVDPEVDRELEQAHERALAGIRAALGEMSSITTSIDPTLEKALGAAGAGAEKGVDDLAKRLRSALKRKSQTEIDRLESTRSLVMPGGQLQERTMSPLYYIAKFGLDRFRAALARIELLPGVVQVIEI